MFRIFLPDGTLTEGSRMELALNSNNKYSFVPCMLEESANALIIHLCSYKKPYSVMILDGIQGECIDIVTKTLKNGYCDLSDYGFFKIVTELEYNKLFNLKG